MGRIISRKKRINSNRKKSKLRGGTSPPTSLLHYKELNDINVILNDTSEYICRYKWGVNTTSLNTNLHMLQDESVGEWINRLTLHRELRDINNNINNNNNNNNNNNSSNFSGFKTNSIPSPSPSPSKQTIRLLSEPTQTNNSINFYSPFFSSSSEPITMEDKSNNYNYPKFNSFGLEEEGIKKWGFG